LLLTILSSSVSRAARWNIFIPKSPLCIHFGRPWKLNVGMFYGHLEYFTAYFVIWNIIAHFGTYAVPRKIWQPWLCIYEFERLLSFFYFQSAPPVYSLFSVCAFPFV
jgi:hypothetical protein